MGTAPPHALEVEVDLPRPSTSLSQATSTFARVMVDVLIARHAQSEWNALGRWQGQEDPPLSELGLAQARAAGATVGHVDAIFASDLDRARTTAQVIADAVGVGPVIVDAALRERNAGEWQGLTRAQIEQAYPGALAAEEYPPSWESNASIRARALAAMQRIVHQVPSGVVLVVSHGGLIYALERMLEQEFERIANLHGRWFVATDDALELGARVALIGDEVRVSTPEGL